MRTGRGEGVARSAHRQEPLGAVGQALVELAVKVAFHDGKVQLPLVDEVQQVPGVGGEHPQLEAGVLFQQAAQRAGHDVFPHGQSGAEAQMPPAIGLAQGVPQAQRVVAHGDGCLVQQPAAFGQVELLALVHKQPDAVLGFQRVDVLGYGGLGDVQQLGRPGKVHGLADGQKSLDAEIQHMLRLLCLYYKQTLWKNKEASFYIMQLLRYSRCQKLERKRLHL